MKYINIIICTVFIFSSKYSFSQQYFYKKFSNNYGYEFSTNATIDTTGKILIAGSYFDTLKSFGYLLEIDSNLNIINEQKLIDTTYQYIGLTDFKLNNNKIYITGATSPSSQFGVNSSIYVRETNKSGNDIWSHKIGVSTPYSDYVGMKIEFKNHLLHVLSNKNIDEKYSRFNIMKLDTLGSILMDKDVLDTTYKYNFAKDFVVLPDSGYMVLLRRQFLLPSLPIKFNDILIRTNSNGDTIFTKQLFDNTVDGYNKLEITGDSNLFLIGGERSINNSTHSTVKKVDLNGNIIWTKSYSFDDNYNEYLTTLKILNDKNLLAGGYSADFGMVIYKLDTLGNLIWSSPLGKKINGTITSILPYNNSYYVVGNHTEVNNGTTTSSIIVIKLDSLGNFEFATTINPITKEKESFTIYPNPSNSVININSTMNEDIKEIVLYNNQGLIVNKYSSKTNKIDLSKYANGQYFLKISYNQKFETKKIIKQ